MNKKGISEYWYFCDDLNIYNIRFLNHISQFQMT